MTNIDHLPPGHELHVAKWLHAFPAYTTLWLTDSNNTYADAYTREYDGYWYPFGDGIDAESIHPSESELEHGRGLASWELAAAMANAGLTGEKIR